jgi:hypothetical protein
MRHLLHCFAGLGLALAGLSPAADGQWNPATRFGTTPPMVNADFGRAAALDGAWGVVGAHRFGSSPNQAGAVLLFQRSGLDWSAAGMLQASDRTAADDFGASVSIQGDWLAVGAPLDDPRGTNSGSTYLFQNGAGGWTQTAKLVASDAGTLDQFGASVSLAQGWVLVGSPFDDDRGTDSGAVYAFQYDGQAWTQSAKLTPGAVGDQFGTASSASGDAVAIGAPFDDQRGSDAGAAYVYRRNGATWTLEATLRAADGASGDRFGGAVSLDGDTLIVAASRDDRVGAVDHGSAYIFRRVNGQWTQEAKLIPADSTGNDFFGSAVALRGDWALIGANFDDDRGPNSGSAYLFVFADGAWTESHKFLADDGASQDWFGSAVALGENIALIGAPGDDDGADASGSAYLFGYTPPNLPPTCSLPASVETECSGPNTTVALDGSAASDPDRDPLGFMWTVDDSGASFDDPTSPTPNLHIPSGVGCPFSCRVTLTVTDPRGATAVCQMDVFVNDTTPPTITCPAQAMAPAGGSMDPADTGSPVATDCDPQVALTYADERFDADCSERPLGSYVIRTWTATDRCGNQSTCDQLIEQMRESLKLDIKPGDCPNKHNPRSKGSLKMVLIGSTRVTGAMIDVSSLRLRRADCIAGEATPSMTPPGLAPALDDLTSPPSGADVRCPPLSPDGIDDLVLNFDSVALERALQLSSLGERKVTLMLTGTLTAPGTPLDGVEFVAADSLELKPGTKPDGPSPSGVGTKADPAPTPAPAPTPTPAPIDELPLMPACGTGTSLAVPISLMGLMLFRPRP